MLLWCQKLYSPLIRGLSAVTVRALRRPFPLCVLPGFYVFLAHFTFRPFVHKYFLLCLFMFLSVVSQLTPPKLELISLTDDQTFTSLLHPNVKGSNRKTITHGQLCLLLRAVWTQNKQKFDSQRCFLYNKQMLSWAASP